MCIHADGYPQNQGVHSVHPGPPVQSHFPVVIPGIPSHILPTPAPAIAILPNGVLRTPKAAKERENTEAGETLENVEDSVEASAKLIDGQEENEETTTEKPKSNDAVIFRD